MSSSDDWTKEEEASLRAAVLQHGTAAWESVAAEVKTRSGDNPPSDPHQEGWRSPAECQQRWSQKLWPGLEKKFWDEKEDELLLKMVKVFGTDFEAIAGKWPSNYRRSEQQIRQRWSDHLDPTLSRQPWTAEEDLRLLRFHAKWGNKWSQIARVRGSFRLFFFFSFRFVQIGRCCCLCHRSCRTAVQVNK